MVRELSIDAWRVFREQSVISSNGISGPCAQFFFWAARSLIVRVWPNALSKVLATSPESAVNIA